MDHRKRGRARWQRQPACGASGRDATNCVGGVLESNESIWTEEDFLPGIPYRTDAGDVTSLAPV